MIIFWKTFFVCFVCFAETFLQKNLLVICLYFCLDTQILSNQINLKNCINFKSLLGHQYIWWCLVNDFATVQPRSCLNGIQNSSSLNASKSYILLDIFFLSFFVYLVDSSRRLINAELNLQLSNIDLEKICNKFCTVESDLSRMKKMEGKQIHSFTVWDFDQNKRVDYRWRAN